MKFLANTTSPFVRIARISMIEKGLNPELTIVDPWADDVQLRQANVATRVPTLVLDDGSPLTECLLIVQWLEATRPEPQWPSLMGKPDQVNGVIARAGVAMGAIDASVITLITRKVSAPALFDETPIGLRRRRTMVEAMQRLDDYYARQDMQALASAPPTLDVVCAVTLQDYQLFRYADQPWLPDTKNLKGLSLAMRSRPSFAQTVPH